MNPQKPTKDLWDFEVRIDTDGTGSNTEKRPLIQEDNYNGKILSVDAKEGKDFDDPTKKETQLVFLIRPDGHEFDLPLWVRPYITKSQKIGVSDSKLYTMLEKAGVIERVPDYKEQIKQGGSLRLFLEKYIVGRPVRFSVVTAKKGTENQYSRVGNIIRFLDETKGVQ